MIKRGSSVDQVGLPCSSNVSPENQMTGRNPIALPDAPLPINRNDGGSRAIQPGTPVSVVTTPPFKANDGCSNPTGFVP